MIKGVVYRYVSPDGKCYVGQTIDETRRKWEFKRSIHSNSYRSSKLKEAIGLYGFDNFEYEVLFIGEYASKEEAQRELYKMEMYFIEYFDSYNNGYNMTFGGDGVKGHRLEGEAKESMIKKLKEYYSIHDNPFKGKKHSDDTKKILSEHAKLRVGKKAAMYGKHISEKQKEVLSKCAKQRIGEKNPFFGKLHKESTKKKISDANSKPVCQIDSKTGEILNEFSSAFEAGKYLGNPRLNSEIVKCCRGYISPSGKRYLTCKGYKWKYKE